MTKHNSTNGVEGRAPGDPCTFPNCKGGQCCMNPSNAVGVGGTPAPSVDDLMELARQYAHAYFNFHTAPLGTSNSMLGKTHDALREALTRGVKVREKCPGCLTGNLLPFDHKGLPMARCDNCGLEVNDSARGVMGTDGLSGKDVAP